MDMHHYTMHILHLPTLPLLLLLPITIAALWFRLFSLDTMETFVLFGDSLTELSNNPDLGYGLIPAIAHGRPAPALPLITIG